MAGLVRGLAAATILAFAGAAQATFPIMLYAEAEQNTSYEIPLLVCRRQTFKP